MRLWAALIVMLWGSGAQAQAFCCRCVFQQVHGQGRTERDFIVDGSPDANACQEFCKSAPPDAEHGFMPAQVTRGGRKLFEVIEDKDCRVPVPAEVVVAPEPERPTDMQSGAVRRGRQVLEESIRLERIKQAQIYITTNDLDCSTENVFNNPTRREIVHSMLTPELGSLVDHTIKILQDDHVAIPDVEALRKTLERFADDQSKGITLEESEAIVRAQDEKAAAEAADRARQQPQQTQDRRPAGPRPRGRQGGTMRIGPAAANPQPAVSSKPR